MKTPAPIISLLKPEQIDAAVALFCAQLSEHHLPNNAVEIRAVVKQLIADETRGFVLVVSSGGMLVGIALGCSYLGVEHGGESGWLEELFVTPEWRGQGLGSKLIEEVIRLARARGWRALDLEVTEDHQRVASLYRRHGFQLHSRSRYFLKLD
ncbi:MAG TPA: GNAT family N-acetyltransferase [Verrucomicrobiae bacterium]|jgi:GNAT superfamily N-acetyltransferase|nr:GNAT family N-acetyltransferase [Verrucomicrobiae bacterium]